MAIHRDTKAIRDFIIAAVGAHPAEIAKLTAEHFGISRQAATRHLRSMEAAGLLKGSGQTRSRRYHLEAVSEMFQTYFIKEGFEEHVPWEEDVRPRIEGIPKNVMDICAYGFTEMLNNAIDHSVSTAVTVSVTKTAESVEFQIMDIGVGIFRKIKDELGLNDEMEAICELAKGKLTTDPKHHTGEGIFFTSRLFDYFSVLSGTLFFSHTRPDDDWLIENRERDGKPGTLVSMKIGLDSTMTQKEIFDTFSDEDYYAFSKTHVPVKLMQYGQDNLLSRSQAKRLVSRFDKFKEVILDFSGVEMIGQAFADEIFRVFKNEHPGIELIPMHTTEQVRQMISRATSQNTQNETNVSE